MLETLAAPFVEMMPRRRCCGALSFVLVAWHGRGGGVSHSIIRCVQQFSTHACPRCSLRLVEVSLHSPAIMSSKTLCCFDGTPSFSGLFALSGTDGRIRIYEPPLSSMSPTPKGLNQGSVKVTLKAAAKDISLSDSNVQLCWSRSSKSSSLGTIAVGHASGKISLWDVTRGVSTTIGPSSSVDTSSSSSGSLTPLVTALAFSPDGQTLYAAFAGCHTIDMYDVRTATVRKKIKVFSKDKASLSSEPVSFALTNSGLHIAVYIGGGTIKVLDVESGKKVRKYSVPASSQQGGGLASSVPVLSFSPCGRALVVGPAGVSAAIVLQVGDLNDEDDDGAEPSGSKRVVLSLDSPALSVSFSSSRGSQTSSSSSSFCVVSYLGGATAYADFKGSSPLSSGPDGCVVGARFHAGDAPEGQLLVVRHGSSLGLHPCFETKSLFGSGGAKALLLNAPPPPPDAAFASAEKNKSAGGKRAQDADSVLGPGEKGAGGPSHDLTDVSAAPASGKKARKGSDAADDGATDFGGVDEPSIAERLQSLTQQLDDDSDSEDERESKKSAKSGLTISNSLSSVPRSESLVLVLSQALTSQDESQLEVAFQCHDRSIIETTIAQLNPASVMALLTKLVSRIAKRPARADALGIWIHVLLQQHTSVFLSNELLSRKLGPLKNLLQERCETLPHLLQLDGRLSLLDFDFK